MNWRGLRSLRPSGRRLKKALAVAALLAVILLGLGSAILQLWGRHHLRKAKEALDRHDAAEASGHLVHCLRLWPRDPATLLLAARAARKGDRPDEAERLLRAYYRHGGDIAAEGYAVEAALLRVRQGDVDGVLAQCQTRVEQHHPATPDILEALIQGYISQHRVPEAEVTVAIWLDRYPDDPQGIYLRGWVKEYRNVPERAAEDYRRSLELRPGRDDVQLRLASCLLGSSQPAETLPLLEGLCRARADHPPTRLLRARALYAVGRLEDARSALEKLLADFPRYPPALTELGRLELQQGRPGAGRWLAEAVALAPGDSGAWYLLSQALGRQKKRREADEALARFKSLQKDQHRLREIATREMSRRPRDPGLHHEVGAILLRAGEAREGLRWLKKALEVDPEHRPTHEALAGYYQRIGQIGLASRHRQLAGAKPPEEGR